MVKRIVVEIPDGFYEDVRERMCTAYAHPEDVIPALSEYTSDNALDAYLAWCTAQPVFNICECVANDRQETLPYDRLDITSHVEEA